MTDRNIGGDLLRATLESAAGLSLDPGRTRQPVASDAGRRAMVVREALFAEGVPAADDLGGVVELEFVVLVLAADSGTLGTTCSSSTARTITL